jgi:hypothetical protein
LTSLNNLTRQVQFFGTGTSGTDFGIVSSVATHTFNLPIASATNTGKLSSTDWSTFNGKVPYTGANANLNLGVYELLAQNAFLNGVSGVNGGNLFLRQDIDFGQSAGYTTLYSTGKNLGFVSYVGSFTYNALFSLNSLTNNSTRTYTLPDLSGTIALLEGTQTFSGAKTFSALSNFDNVIRLKQNLPSYSTSSGYTTLFSTEGGGQYGFGFYNGGGALNSLNFPTASSNTYTFPAASGTIALTSNLSSYVPYTGATTNVNLGVYSLTANQLIAGGASTDNVATLTTYDQGHALKLKGSTGDLFFVPYFSPSIGARITAQNSAASANTPLSFYASNFYFNSNVNFGSTLGNGTYTYTLPSATGTLALTSNLSAYLPLAGGTLTGALSGTSATWNNINVFTGAAIGAGSQRWIGSDGGAGLFLNTPSGSGLNLAINNIPVLGFDSTGAATFSSSVTATTFEATDIESGVYANYFGPYSGGSSSILNFLYGSSGSVTWNNGGVKMTLNSSGSLGIGTSSPATKLDVSGTIRPIAQTDPTSGVGMELFYRAADTSSYIQSYDRTNGAWKDVRIYGSALFFGSQGTNHLQISSGGQVGINTIDGGVQLAVKSTSTTSSSYPLFLFNSAGTGLFYVRSDGYIITGTAASSPYNLTSGNAANMVVGADGTLYRSTSSLKYKTNVKTYDKGLNEVMQLNPVYYNSKNNREDGIQFAGLIAEEVHELGLTEFVQYAEDGTPDALAYSNMVALAFKAIQEQTQIIKDLEARIVSLESK